MAINAILGRQWLMHTQEVFQPRRLCLLVAGRWLQLPGWLQLWRECRQRRLPLGGRPLRFLRSSGEPTQPHTALERRRRLALEVSSCLLHQLPARDAAAWGQWHAWGFGCWRHGRRTSAREYQQRLEQRRPGQRFRRLWGNGHTASLRLSTRRRGAPPFGKPLPSESQGVRGRLSARPHA